MTGSFLTSGVECGAPGRGLRETGQAVRPSAEHGGPDVRLTLGAAGVRSVLRRPRRTGTSIVAGAEADRSPAGGVQVRRRGARGRAFWLLDGQAEEGGRKDELA